MGEVVKKSLDGAKLAPLSNRVAQSPDQFLKLWISLPASINQKSASRRFGSGVGRFPPASAANRPKRRCPFLFPELSRSHPAARATLPPRFPAPHWRAQSTRICRMSCDAIAKKCVRPSHRGASTPTSRKKASCTKAALCRVWSGRSLCK